MAGGIAAGIYTTNGPEACKYVARHSQAVVIVVENQEQLNKILLIQHQLPALKAIVQYLGNPILPPISISNPNSPNNPNNPNKSVDIDTSHLMKDKRVKIYSWKAFLSLGSSVAEGLLGARMKSQRPGQCCTLIYTSGTTGEA